MQKQRNRRAQIACRLGLALMASAVLHPAPTGAAEALPAETPAAPLRIAFSGSMFVDVNENDAGAAVRAWAQMLGSDRGIPVDPAVKILRGTNALAEATRSRAIDGVLLATDEYWALRRGLSFTSFIYGVRAGSITEEYVLLVRQDSQVESIRDLRGRSLDLFLNPRTSLASAWVGRLLAQQGAGNPPDFFGRITPFSKLTRALLPVFFGQADACVVTRAGLETACELNPQIGRRLKVLAASPAVVPVVFCLCGDSRSPYRAKLLQEIGKVNSTPAGQQFMTLFQCDTLEEGDETSMNSAFELLGAGDQVCVTANQAKAMTLNVETGANRD
jgi:phosphonate transport system substrate-binding protein